MNQLTKEKKIRKITLGLILSWLFGIIFGIAGLVFLAEGNFEGVFLILISVILLPPINRVFKEQYNFELSRGLKIILVIVLFTIFGMLSPSEKPDYTGRITTTTQVAEHHTTTTTTQPLITKPAEEMLPTRSEIATEFMLSDVKDNNLTAFGFIEGKTLSTDSMQGGQFITIEYYVWRFSSIDSAKSYYDSRVNKIKEIGGYTKLSISGCFAFKEDYGYIIGKSGTSICQEKNVVYSVWVSMERTYKSPDGYLKDSTKLLRSKIK